MFTIRCFEDFAVLPPAHRALVDAAAQRSFFHDPDWFGLLLRHVFQHRLRIYAVEDGDTGRVLLVMPLRASHADYAAPGARALGAISHPENYAPVAMLFAPEVHNRDAVLLALFRHLRAGRSEPPVDALRLWPFEDDSATGRMLRRCLLRAGFMVQRYENSFNRYEDTTGLDYDTYFAARSANQRYNVRRRHRALARDGGLELALHRDPGDALDGAVRDYIAVSQGSWKTLGSMVSEDLLELIGLAAAKGCLRLGILRVHGVPAAAQLWIVTGGVAHCARLAYHEDFKQQAVGVVLTNFMIAHVLDQDRAQRIDFGFGEEDYKGGWMKEARDYYGYMAFNPTSRRGLVAGIRNVVGRPLKRSAKWVLRSLRLRAPDAPVIRGRAGRR